MATRNDKGAKAPTQPDHPFIVPDDPEGTNIRTEAVLAFVQEYTQPRALAIDSYDDHPGNTNHLYGLIYVLGACREAVTALGHMAAPSIVTKLEVGND